jgi:hypothetical protein
MIRTDLSFIIIFFIIIALCVTFLLIFIFYYKRKEYLKNKKYIDKALFRHHKQ